MKRTSKLMATALLVAVLGASAGGCAFLQNMQDAFTALGGASVSYNVASAGVVTYNTLQSAGSAYLRLPTCTARSGPICHDRRATNVIGAVFVSGRVARDKVIAFMREHPCATDPTTGKRRCPLMPDGVFAGLRDTIDTMKQVYAQYKVTYAGG